MSTDQAIEQQIQAVGANVAPRITPDDVEANISSEFYFTAADGIEGARIAHGVYLAVRHDDQRADIATGQVTFCMLILRNGAKLVGINYGAIDPAQHSVERGRQDARADAIRQVWLLMGYELRSKLAFGSVGGDLATLGKLDFIGSVEPLTDNDANPLLSFGDALEVLKAGAKVARLGWNGKGMWLSLSGPLQGREVQAHAFWSDNNRAYAERLDNKTATVLPAITMKTATGEILMGWLASQTDMLAEDWQVVE